MNHRQVHIATSWVLLFILSNQIVFAEVVRSDGQPRVVSTTITKEVVRTDGQPRVTTPAVAKEVVRTDGQPRSTTTPAINPFVGEIAVGVSLLVTYGPQIIALAATVATLAAAIHTIGAAGKSSFDVVKSIGTKLKNLLSLLLGPLGISTGMTKTSVEDVSAHLLNVTKFVANSISTPVDQIQDKLDTSLALSRDVEALSRRGRDMADYMKNLAEQTGSDLKNITAGGEIQLLRDGTGKVADRLGRQAANIGGAFDQTIINSRTTISQLEGIKAQIEGALQASGRAASEVTLHDLQISGAELSKKLIEARKYMIQSDKALVAADKSNSNLHVEILNLLSGIKEDLETYAKMNGIDPEKLTRTMQDPTLKKSLESATVPTIPTDKKGNQKYQLTDEISFMLEKIDSMKQSSSRSFSVASAESTQNEPAVQPLQNRESAATARLHQQKVQAFKAYMEILAREPGNAKAIESAQKSFEKAEQLYRESLENDSKR